MIIKILSFASIFFFASTSLALPGYTGSAINDEQQEEVARYRLVLSELENNPDGIYGEVERIVSGQLTRRVYTLPDHAQLNQVMAFYLSTLEKQQQLFSCVGIVCGSSNFWANDVFDQPRIVSRNKDQAYLVTLGNASDGLYELNVVYISMRGGRQGRVLVDTLLTPDAITNTDVALASIRSVLSESSGWLPYFKTKKDQMDSELSQPLINELNALSNGLKQRLYLIVHCYQGKRMEDTQACSDTLANQLRLQVDERIQISSQGALTPAPTTSDETALRFLFWPSR
ncbi:MAG: DUF4892 domain-containing protein [Oleibacter sp.]|nr:DUF4892 domain-containing protein [Thalassolituus sp.]